VRAAAEADTERAARQHRLRAARRWTAAGIDILVIDDIDVRTVAHTSRTPNRRQRAALLADRECEIRGCAATRGLEIDHIEPRVDTRRTTIEALSA